MRVLLLLAAVAVVLLGAGVFFLGTAPPAPVPPPAEPGPAGPPGPDGPAPAPAPPVPKRRPDLSDQPPLPSPRSVPRRLPQPMPPGGAGEIQRPDLPAADREKVEALKGRLIEARIGAMEWRHEGLRKVLDYLAAKTSIPFEIEGEGLDDEPIMGRDAGDNVLEFVRRITMARNLRFEVTAEKVIVRR